MKYRRYDDAFNVEAVELALQPDVQTQEVAARLGIHPFMLSRWKKAYREGRFMAKAPKAGGVKAGGVRYCLPLSSRLRRQLWVERRVVLQDAVDDVDELEGAVRGRTGASF
jgi:transposase